MKTIGLFPNTLKTAWKEITEQILGFCEKNGLNVIFEPAELKEHFAEANCIASEACLDEADMVIALGGDGTMLTLARLIGRAGIPIMGVNLGGLGFLAEYSSNNLLADLKEIITGEFVISRRMALECRITKNGKGRQKHYALNEAVISGASRSRLVQLIASMDDEYINSFSADGLIVATPTGSTAYSLSAGGPIVTPETKCLLVTPISPHTLSNRPILISSDKKIKVEMPPQETDFKVTLDGQVSVDLKSGDAVELTAAKEPIKLITSKHTAYFEILRSKLGWGGSKIILD